MTRYAIKVNDGWIKISRYSNTVNSTSIEACTLFETKQEAVNVINKVARRYSFIEIKEFEVLEK